MKVLVVALVVLVSPSNNALAQDGDQEASLTGQSSHLIYSLSMEEKAWLTEHGPKVRVSLVNLPPLQFEQDGEFTGYQVDILEAVLKKAGLQPDYTLEPFATVFADFKEKKTEISLDFFPTEERRQVLLFSKKMFDVYVGIFARKERTDLNSIEALKNARIASHPGYGLEPKLKRLLPDAEIVHAVDPQGMFNLVSSGKADAVVHGLEGGNFIVQKNMILNVMSHGNFLPKGESRLQAAEFVVRKDLPHLMSIIDKTYASIAEAEKQAIWDEWFGKNDSKLKTSSILYSDMERAWIAQNHTVRVRVADRPPFIFLDKKRPAGLSVDLIDEVSKRTGIQFHYVLPPRSFKEDLNGLIQHVGPDLILTLTPTKEREKIIDFTKSYMSSPKFIFIRENSSFVASLEELDNKTVAVVDGFIVHDILARDYPKINLMIVKNSKDALSAVSLGKAYAFIDSIFTTPAMINKFGFKNLKATAQVSTLPVSSASMGVRNDWPELRDILDKAIESIPPDKMTAMVNKWSTIKFDHGLKPSDIWKWVLVVVGFASTLVFLFIFWNRSLAKQVRDRTAELEYQAILLENVSDAVVSIDLDFRIMSWNAAAEKTYGWKTEEVVGEVFAELTAIEYNNDSREEVFRQIPEKGTWQGEIVQSRKDGARIILQTTLSVVKNKNGDPIGYVGVNRDITEKKKIEEELKKSDEYFSKAFHAQALPMAIINVKSGERLDFNESYIEMCGYSRKELQEDTITTLKLWGEDHDREKGIEQLLRERVVRDVSADLVTKSGKIKNLLGSAAMIEFGQKNLAITTWLDISKRKQAEKQIQEYQTRLKALASQLTIAEEVERSRIAVELHDHVGQTLAFLHIQVGRAQRFAAEEKLQGILEEVSEQLLVSIQYTKELVFDLSSALLYERGITTAIADWLEDHVSRKNGINTELIGNYDELFLSRDLKSILFRNVRELLANVIKHSQATKVTVSLENNSSQLSIIVLDDGVGCELGPETIDNVSSSGFGLFSIRERLDDYGGSLDIISSPGKGCKVTMSIPM
ncbi:PAS domain-containing sensor histidine kinase [Desulforhopalus sp. 52FAK]